MKQILLMIAVVALVGCGSPQGINQTSKVKIGTPIWEVETGGIVRSSPAIGSDGTVYVGSYDNKLYAINGKLYAIKTDSKGPAKSPRQASSSKPWK